MINKTDLDTKENPYFPTKMATVNRISNMKVRVEMLESNFHRWYNYRLYLKAI